MSHHDHAPIPRDPQPSLQDRLWEAQEQLHDIARRLDRPGPHGAQYPSDIYDILGALKVTTSDIAEIIQRASRLMTDGSDRELLTRPCSLDDCVWLEASAIYARLLARTLEKAQSSVSDIGGHLTSHSPPKIPPRNN